MSPTTSPLSNLDTDRLRKVAALMTSGATKGERAAARSRGDAIAAAAGLALDDALSILDTPPTITPGGFFAGFEDWMEKREPGHKVRAARERAEREAARMARCVDHLRRFGSRGAVFAETPDERRLRETLAPLADHRAFMDSEETYVAGYCGWTGGEQPPELVEALGRALPFPETIGAVRAELATWDALDAARMDLEPLGEELVWIRARCHALERLMDTIPAPTVAGFRARLAWLEELNGHGFTRPVERDTALIATLRADFDAIVEGLGTAPAPVQSGHATASQRRRDVRTMLARHPDMPDREIARRCGVSPQTVGNQRRAVAGQ